MKQSLTKKLTLYFSLTLLVTSIVIAVAYTLLFSRLTMNLHKEDMQQRGEVMADTMATYFSEKDDSSTHVQGQGSGMGYGAFLRFTKQLAMDDIWITDKNADIILIGNADHHQEEQNAQPMPAQAKKIAASVFQTKQSVDETTGNFWNIDSITLGIPIKDGDGNVKAAILLHSKINELHRSFQEGRTLLFVCIGCAFLIGLVLSIVFARRFIRPIHKMRAVTEQLVSENYGEKYFYDEKNELGSLAESLNILSARLQQAKEAQETKDQAQKNFLSQVSHELKTPVAVMRASLETLTDGLTLPDEVEEYHQSLLKEAILLDRLVQDILELSRLENPQFSIEKQSMNLLDCANDAARSMRVKSSEKNQEIHVQAAIELPKIQGDYSRVRQLLTILLDNACKFGNSGSTIDLTIQQQDGSIRLCVHNIGSFIPEKEYSTIFQRFNKTSESNGYGLGLAIAKEICLKHDFTLQVASQQTTGTSFIVIIPFS